MEKIKKRTFDYDQKENYTPLEVKAILGQHSTFLAGASAKEVEELRTQVSTLETSNKELTTAERKRSITKIAKSIDADNFEKIIKYAKVADDASTEDITQALNDVAKDFVKPISTKEVKTTVKGDVPTPSKADSKLDKFKGL